MASLFTNPLQALVGQDDRATTGPLEAAETAKANSERPVLDQNWVYVGDSIDGTRWNKSYPYQLLMLKKTGGGYSIEDRFTLPIPPTDLSISTPFAITTSVTLGGIVEEHNAAPMRTISFNGTTGVLPLKGSAGRLPQSSVIRGIFAGTVNAAINVGSSLSTLTGSSVTNLVDDGADDVTKGTGYYQFRLLQKYLESYASLKAQGNQALRLALAIWKDQAIYLVSPTDFTVRRSATSPWEYSYSLQFKAWRRVSLDTTQAVSGVFQSVTRDPNAFAQLLNKISEGRRVLQNSRDVLLGVKADADKLLLEPLRQVTLFCKDAIGVAATAADLPASIWASLKPAVLQAQGLVGTINTTGKIISQDTQKALAQIKSLSVETLKAATKSGTLSGSGAALTGSSEANRIFEHPEENFELLDLIKPSELSLSPDVQRKINAEKEQVRSFTRLDFEALRDQFVEFEAQYADAVGAGSDTYNQTYNRPTQAATRTATTDDYDILFSLNQIILEMNRLAASSDIDPTQVTTIDSVAGMARASGIAFTTPASKFAVPFPYGSTLEQIAAQYLGDPNRWHEIVALNGLQQPYVDETGFDLPLQVNGDGSQVVVSDSTNLFIGQLVWLSSSLTSRTQRHITKIEKISATTTILTLDGDQDLGRFTTAGAATLHAFLPGTVNSQQLIYIPSDEQPDEEDFLTKSIPGVNEFDPMIQAGGVDLLLDQNGDLVITPDGDCRLAVGLTNLIQRIRTALSTPRGSLLHHPDYGLGIVPGISTADVDPKAMLAALQEMFRNDSAFSGVTGVAISKAGPVLRVSMSVGVAGTNQTIPVTVDLRR